MQRLAMIALGAVLVLIGATFTLQGLGYLAGSAMTGVTTWAIIGPIVVVIGLVVAGRGTRAGRSGRSG